MQLPGEIALRADEGVIIETILM